MNLKIFFTGTSRSREKLHCGQLNVLDLPDRGSLAR